MIDGPKQDRTKVQTPVAVITFLQANRISTEHLADEDVVAAPSDLAVLAHHADLPGIGVNELRQMGGIEPRRRPIDHTRRGIADRFVRALLVVGPAKAIEAPLLLVPTVLRRAARSDALRLYPKLDPPYGKPRKPTNTAARKWRPIVTANGQRQ